MIIIILGLPRSGTTLLGAILNGPVQTVYLEEPNAVWRYRNYARLGHDAFSAIHATEAVRNYIRARFEAVLAASPHADILVEKTPTNALRPEFVRAVFPDARFIIMRRDAAAVRDSIYRRVTTGEDNNVDKLGDKRVFRDLRIRASKFMDAPLRDWPSYLPQITSDLTKGLLFPANQFWGPRHPEWRADMKCQVIERIDRQCQAMEGRLNRFMQEADPSTYFEMSYEKLLKETQTTLAALEDYIGLPSGALDTNLLKR